jgi:hypothetical protein
MGRANTATHFLLSTGFLYSSSSSFSVVKC